MLNRLFINVLIINGLLLILLWTTGFIALQTGQLNISISIAFIFILQLWSLFQLTKLSKSERESRNN